MDTSEVAVRESRPAPIQNRFAGRRGVGAGNNPDFISTPILYVIGHSYFSLERYVAAETAFKIALVAMPNHARAHESLGMLSLRAARYEDARGHLLSAVDLGRNSAQVHAALGYLEQETKHYVAAANAFQRVLVLEPDNRTALRGLMLALIETREHAKARAHVEQLLRAEPDDVDLWRYRAHIALASGDRERALASLEAALRLGDDSAANARACVALHIETGNIGRAAELLLGSARGLEFALVDRVLGWLANENEWDDYRELVATVDRAALGGTEQSRLLTRRASLALHDGDARAASAALDEALTLDPANGDALVARGRLYRSARDYGRADLLFQRASNYGAVRESALVARAEVAVEQENFAGALELLQRAAAENPALVELRRSIDVLEDLVLLRPEP
jgi:tetratricopeptide (TPR) repeat protein